MRRTLSVLAVAAAACAPAADSVTPVVIATTTSVEDSGLIDALVPAFAEAHPGLPIQVIAVGSGEAIAMGRRKDADLLLTHAPWQEASFVVSGDGIESTTIMYNHFVVVGPSADPAHVRGAANVADALRRIADLEAPFLTRGDSSGTHLKERGVWEQAQILPDADMNPWYIESGVGMGDLLRVAAERGAYTLSDRATFLTNAVSDALVILLDDESDALYNPYSATLVSGARNLEGARVVYDWLRGPGQSVIAGFGVDRFGRALFEPALTR
jgi:tungstate transport system substrate-binding protein